MALTVGELNAIITIDDRAVDPALRRTEQALRQSGRRLGSDAENAGQQAGQQLGGGFVRGADGQWRNIGGGLVDAVTAARLEAESEAHRAGARIAAGLTDDLNDGLTDGARRAGGNAGNALGDGLTDGAGDGADSAVAESESRLSKLKGAALGIGAAAGAVLVDAFGQAMEQSKITAKLGASMGKTPAEAQRYGKIAGSLYADAVTEDFQGAADAIGSIMAAGLVPPNATNGQIESITANLHDLSDTFELDLGQAANAAGQLIKTGLAKNAGEAFDVMTRGMQVMGPRADDLADTINEYSTIFRQVGINATDMTGILAQGMAAGARDTDVVADSVKELVLITQKGGSSVDQAFASIGLSGSKMQAAFSKGGPDAKKALDQIFDSLRKVKDPAKRAQLAVSLFGTKAEDMQKALFAIDPSKAASALGKVGGAADKMGNSLRDNASTKVESFKRTVQQSLVNFLAANVIPPMTKFFGFVQEHSTVFKALAIGVTVLGVAFSVASIGVWAMNTAIFSSPVFWIIAGITALVIAIIAIATKTTWFQDLWHTVWGAITSATSSAISAISSTLGWFASLPGKIAGWFGAAKDWAIRKFVELNLWMAGLPGRIFGALAGMVGSLAKSASNAFTAFRVAAVQRALAFVDWVRGLPGRILRGIGNLQVLLYNKGVNVVQGLWNGIQAMGGWIRSKIIGWAKSAIPGPIAKALGISSPSKVTKAQGRWIARGLIDGLTGSTKQVKAASTKLSDIIRDSLSPGRKRSKALAKVASGTKQLTKLANREAALASRLKTATKKLSDQIKARDALAADVKKGVLEGADITKQDTGGWPQTADTILAGLKQDRQAAETFAKNLATLRKKGVRSDLIAQIAQAGVEQGSSAAAALAQASSGQIKQINKEQGALVTAAGKAGSTAGTAMYGAGIAAGQGLVKGLQAQQKAIEAQMLKIAKSMSKSIKKALGIKSPSKVMAQVGAYTAQGLVKGMEGERSAVNRSMASLVETPAAGSWDGASPRARAAAAQRVVVEFRGSDRGESAYLMGKMRRGVQKTTGGDVEFAFSGRRSN